MLFNWFSANAIIVNCAKVSVNLLNIPGKKKIKIQTKDCWQLLCMFGSFTATQIQTKLIYFKYKEQKKIKENILAC